MEKMIKNYNNFINESKKESFEEFSLIRLNGAKKIAENAKEKVGDALLTYHHFKDKIPTYKKAKDGEFDMINSKKEYETLLEKLYKSTKDNMKISQVEFQELVGRIEVLGELIIRKEIE